MFNKYYSNRDTLLLIIDTQANMFGPDVAIHEPDQLVQVVGDLIARARAAQVPIIFVRNNGSVGDPDIHGTPGWEFDPRLAPQSNEPIVDKTTPDSFKDTPLQSLLAERGIRNLILAGMQTDFCIQTTARRAAALGYTVTVVADGHSTFDSGTLTAAEIIAGYNAQLQEVATVLPAQQINFSPG